MLPLADVELGDVHVPLQRRPGDSGLPRLRVFRPHHSVLLRGRRAGFPAQARDENRRVAPHHRPQSLVFLAALMQPKLLK
jgi:hypothetical protein